MKHLSSDRFNGCLLGLTTIVLALVVIPLGMLSPIVDYDTVVRYAPMAEAFADGNWHEAFHPRFGVLYPVLTGFVTWLTPLDGLQACKFIALFSWVLAIVPVFSIAHRVFDTRVAWVSVVLYIICPITLQLAFKGLREPLRLLGLLLVIRCLFVEYEHRKSSVYEFILFSVGLVILSLIKVDSVFFAYILWRVFSFVNRFGWRTGASFLVMAGALQAPCYLVWQWTGWWVPMPQLSSYLERVF